MTGWVYPNGVPGGSEVLDSLNNAIDCKIARGWPLKTTLQADIAAGIANISVYAQPGSERNTTRFPKTWRVLTEPPTPLTATVTGQTVTLSGPVFEPQNVAVVTNGQSFVYPIQVGDDLSTIASGLAGLINASVGATSSGPVITIPDGVDIAARAGAAGTMVRELRRQERLFQITCWCVSPDQRDALAKFIDGQFAGAGQPNGLEFINLADGTAARLLYVRTLPIDRDELSGSWRRDLIYSLEYATTDLIDGFQIVTVETDLTTGPASADVTSPTVTLNI